MSRATVVLAAAITIGINCLPAQSAPEANKNSGTDLKINSSQAPTKLYGQINAFGTACVSSGITPLSTQLPTSIEFVKPGSPAYYAGVAKGDKILSATLETNRINLKIERNSQIFLVKLRARTDAAPRPKLTTAATRFNLFEKLRAYKLAFLIDRSGSMASPLGNSDKMRWTFLKEQFEEFWQAAQSNGVSSFDLCLFAEDFSLTKNCSCADMTREIEATVTTGNTVLAPALKATLEAESKAADKPLLLFIVTDGQAMAGKEVLQTICDIGARFANGKRIKLIFIQTGYSEEGARFVSSLSAECKRRGMADFVQAILYEEIAQKGVAPAIEPLFIEETRK